MKRLYRTVWRYPVQMWVKICANTNLDDTLAAISAGADAVGFVFAPSKRQVSIEQARQITHRLPADVERIGVFSERKVESISDAVQLANLSSVQLHGGIDLDFASRLRERLGSFASIIHVVHWDVGPNALARDEVSRQLEALAATTLDERVLIDARVGNASGGLGVSFNWNEAATILSHFPQLRFIVAGGLRPETVAEATAILHPYGVDVASGVEREPGRKDEAKLQAFVAEARR